MPYSGNTYTAPTGATNASPGQVVQSATWNAIHTDMSAALTTLMTALNTNTPGFQNLLMHNGSFQVWQRGTTISVPASTTKYTADRWYAATGLNQACTISAVADLGASATPNCALKFQRNAVETGTTVLTLGYPFDSDEVYRMRGSLLSFSCRVKSGLNWSPTSGTLTVTAAFGTGSPAKRGAGFTGETVCLTIATNLTLGATTVISGTGAVTVPLTAVQGELQFTWTPTGTAGTDDSISIDECCLVLGSIIQTYADIPFQEQLLLCKRHYQKTFPYSVAPAQGAGLPGALGVMSSAAARFGIFWQVGAAELRTTATYTTYNPSGASANWQDVTAGASLTASIDTVNSASPKGVLIYGASATAAADLIYIHADADASI